MPTILQFRVPVGAILSLGYACGDRNSVRLGEVNLTIYLVGPQFSLAEREFNEAFARSLERHAHPSIVVWRQNHANSLAASPTQICRQAIDRINRSDAVVAILDGADADAATCVEIGYAKGRAKVIVGFRTDCRQCEDRGLNLMVSNICSHLIVQSSNSVSIDELAKDVVMRLTNTLGFAMARPAE